MHRFALFSPDIDGMSGGDSAVSAPPAPAVSAPVVAPSAPPSVGATESASQPSSSQMVPITPEDHARFTRAVGKASDHDRRYGQVREAGFDSFDDAISAAARLRAIESDPQLSAVLAAMQASGGSDQPTTEEPTAQQALTPATLAEFLDRRDADKQAAEFQQKIQRDQVTEDSLIEAQIKGGDFKDVFGETSFTDALAGSGNPIQTGLAVLLDDAVYRSASRNGDQVLPHTDPAAIAKAVDGVRQFVKAIQSDAILKASRGLGGSFDRPDESAPIHRNGEEPTRSEPWDEKAAAEHFSREMKRMSGAVGAL